MDLSVALVALYLRGLEGRPWSLPARGWPALEAAWRSAAGSGAWLQDAGLWREAVCLESPGLVARASDLLASGQVISAACPAYPARWRSVLGSGAPPALWSAGSPFAAESVSIAGSRKLSRAAASFALGLGSAAARSGLALVSGGAYGADRLSVRAAQAQGAACLEVWPCGLQSSDFRVGASALSGSEVGWVLSVAGPQERFSTALAMERNALVYAASPLAVVVDCRLKEGGSWHGAIGAMRKRLALVAAREAPASAGLRALVALGASPLSHPDLLPEAYQFALSHPVWAQQSLFGAA